MRPSRSRRLHPLRRRGAHHGPVQEGGGRPGQRAAAEKAASTEETRQSAVEKAAAAGEMQTPLVSLPSPPQGSPARELFPAGRDQALPEDDPVQHLEAGREESAGQAEELLAAARRVMKSAKVSYRSLAV